MTTDTEYSEIDTRAAFATGLEMRDHEERVVQEMRVEEILARYL